MDVTNKDFLNALFNKMKKLKETKKNRGSKKKMKNQRENKTHCETCGRKLDNVCGHKFCRNGHRYKDGTVLQPKSIGYGITGIMKTIK